MLTNISVGFSANTSKFQKGLKNLKKDTKSWGNDTKKIAKAAAAGFTAVAAAVGVFGFALNSSIQKLTALQQAADKLDMNVTMYASLKAQMDDLGISIEGLTSSMTALETKMMGAREGSKRTNDAFNTLNINIDKFANLDAAGKIAALAKAWSEAPDGPEKSAAGVELLADQLNNLRPMLEGGTAALMAGAEEATAFGQALSEVDSQNVTDLADTFDDLGDAAIGPMNIIAATFAELVGGPLRDFVDYLKESNAIFNTVRFSIEFVSNGLIGLATLGDLLTDAFNGLKVVFYAVQTGLLALLEAVADGMNTILKTVNDGINFLIDKVNTIPGVNIPKPEMNIDGVVSEIGTAKDAIAELMVEAYDSLGSTTNGDAARALRDDLIKIFDDVERRSDEALAKTKKGIAEVDASGQNELKKPEQTADQKAAAALKELADMERKINGERARAGAFNPELLYETQLAELEDFRKKALITEEQFTAAKIALDEKRAKSEYDIWARGHELQAMTVEGFAGVVEAMSSAIGAGESLSSAFKNAARSMLADILALTVKALFLNVLYAMLGLSNHAAAAKMVSTLETLSGVTKFGGGKASGGPVTANTAYMVGEKGPEMMIPQSSGYIVPNDMLSGGSQTIVNQTINVETGVSQTVKAEMTQLLPRFKDVAVAAVLDTKMRGGSYASVMAG